MIRINLLDHLPAPTERFQAMLNPGRTGGFISRRETLLGGLFLVLAFGILGTQLWLSQEPVEPESVRPEVARQDPPKPVVAPPPPSFQLDEANEIAEAFAELPPAEAPTPPPQPAAKKAPPPEPALGGDGKITGVRVTLLEDGVDIFLPIKGRPRVRTFRVDNPNRVVFDIPGAILDAPREQQNQRIDSPWVTRLRAAQNELEPPLVRIVLEVPDFPATDNSVSDEGVAIRVRRP